MQTIKISAVSYLNTKPFIYGIEQDGFLQNCFLELDIPSVCAARLISNEVDVGLVPVAVIPLLEKYEILTDYCIGADGPVGSVVLYSEVPLNKIEKIMLDYQSKTSVALVQLLAKKFWGIAPEWIKAGPNYEQQIGGTIAGVVIGDRTFDMTNKFRNEYDLAQEWKKHTSLPFVFACWVANKNLPDEFKNSFNKAVKYGVDNRETVAKKLQQEKKYNTDITNYFNNCISYQLDDAKREAMNLFLKYLSD